MLLESKINFKNTLNSFVRKEPGLYSGVKKGGLRTGE